MILSGFIPVDLSIPWTSHWQHFLPVDLDRLPATVEADGAQLVIEMLTPMRSMINPWG